MVRIAELQIEPEFLEDNLAIPKEEAAASVQLEPGVLCIFPMYQKENPTEIRLLETYTNEAAYRSHFPPTLNIIIGHHAYGKGYEINRYGSDRSANHVCTVYQAEQLKHL